VQRPRGIFPSLPGGMDIVIKKYFNKYRGSLPPELSGKINTDIERARKMLEEAVDLLKGKLPPEHAGGINGQTSCEFGLWQKLAREFD
jgi:hypothetical protein